MSQDITTDPAHTFPGTPAHTFSDTPRDALAGGEVGRPVDEDYERLSDEDKARHDAAQLQKTESQQAMERGEEAAEPAGSPS